MLALSSIRTRRSASAMAMFGTVVTLLLTLLVAWGLTRRSTPFVATYQYFNMSVAFSGPTNFQSFGIQLILHADHLTVVALFVVELCMIGALGWHQVMGRGEPGAARFHAAITALLFACVGVLMSYDLAELFAFWAIAGAMTYLLLASRWGVDENASPARIALALPFLTDLCLLCGIAWLYARYGTQNLSTLIPVLHTNPGWTVRSLVLGSDLLFVGVAGRLALWPFTLWITRTAPSAPPAAVAIVTSAWSVLAIVVLYRVMPILASSSQLNLQVLAGVCGAAAVIAPLLSLFGNEPRRVLLLAGSGAAAIGAGIVVWAARGNSALAIAGVAGVLAMTPARAGGLLALSNIAAAMRTDDLGEMGDAWRRMRVSSIALLASALLVGLSMSGALAYGLSTRSKLGLAAGEAVILIAIGGLRVFLGASFGPLRRRRAFEPDRVREAPGEVLGYPYWLVVGGAAFLGASMIAGSLNFLDGQKHPAPSLGAYVIWAVVALIGFAVTTLAYVRDKDGALAASAAGGQLLWRVTNAFFGLVDRFLVAPVTDLARRIGDWIPAGDGALGRFATTTGQLALAVARAPAVPFVLVLAVLLAAIFALVAPGVAR